MGLFRKMTSAITVGAVDFRSDKERIALYTRQTRNAVRAQNKALPQPPTASESLRQIRDSKAQAKAATAMLERLRSPDPAVRAAALAEYQAEH